MNEPTTKRAIAYFDGQNLFYAAKNAFGYSYPNYNIRKLAEEVCSLQKWDLTQIYFYTGIPNPKYDSAKHRFWVNKLAMMGTRGIKTYSRTLHYSNKQILLKDGSVTTDRVPREKGIDVRLALDVVRGALDNCYDVALLFSQDQDLTEVADEIRRIAKRSNRWIKIACAYPKNSFCKNTRGINGTDWISLSRKLYDNCIDPNDYRKKSSSRKKDSKR